MRHDTSHLAAPRGISMGNDGDDVLSVEYGCRSG